MDDATSTPISLVTEILERRFLTSERAENVVGFTYLSGSIPFDCTIKIDARAKGIYLAAILSLPVPDAYQLTMLEWCNAMNEQLWTGHFAINADRGHLKWQSGSYYWNQNLDEQAVRTLLESSILSIDFHIASLIFVFSGHSEGSDLSEAIALLGKDIGIGTSARCHYNVEPHPSQR
jgi:hypothetical protein